VQDGLTAGAIGIVLAVGTAIRLLTGPGGGRLADRVFLKKARQKTLYAAVASLSGKTRQRSKSFLVLSSKKNRFLLPMPDRFAGFDSGRRMIAGARFPSQGSADAACYQLPGNAGAHQQVV